MKAINTISCCMCLLFSCSSVYGLSGVSSGVGFAQGVFYSFLVWLAACLLVGWVWYKKTEKKWVWIHSPLIVTTVIIVIGSMYTLIVGFIANGAPSSTATKFLDYLICLIIGLVLSYYVYKKYNSKRLRSFIVAILIPLLFLAYIISIWLFT